MLAGVDDQLVVRSRSSRETAAALTNWGRLPTTVTIRTAVQLIGGAVGRRDDRGRCGDARGLVRLAPGRRRRSR